MDPRITLSITANFCHSRKQQILSLSHAQLFLSFSRKSTWKMPHESLFTLSRVLSCAVRLNFVAFHHELEIFAYKRTRKDRQMFSLSSDVLEEIGKQKSESLTRRIRIQYNTWSLNKNKILSECVMENYDERWNFAWINYYLTWIKSIIRPYSTRNSCMLLEPTREFSEFIQLFMQIAKKKKN